MGMQPGEAQTWLCLTDPISIIFNCKPVCKRTRLGHTKAASGQYVCSLFLNMQHISNDLVIEQRTGRNH